MIRFTILGEPASKANSRQLVQFGKGEDARPAIIKSKKARDYERTAALQIPAFARVMLQGPVKVTLKIFYASERPDLDESVVLDVLQAKFEKGSREVVRPGVYLNDRQVREKHVFHAIDRANPRTEIEVEAMAAQDALFAREPVYVPQTKVAKKPKRAQSAAASERPAIPRDHEPF